MSTRLAVFNLPTDVREREVEELFHKFGPIDRVSLKTTREGMQMAFIEFAHPRDADKAQHDRHDYMFEGQRLRVEFSHGKGAPKGGKPRYDSRGRSDSRSRKGGKFFDPYFKGGKDFGKYGPPGKGYYGKSDYYGGKYGGDPYYKGKGKKFDFFKGGKFGKFGGKKGDKDPRRMRDESFKVRVNSLPDSASWQDLKDFFRNCEPGEYIKFTEVFKGEGGCYGVGGFETRAGAEKICDNCDGKEFRARNGDISTVRVDMEPENERYGGRSPSRGRSRSRSVRQSSQPRERVSSHNMQRNSRGESGAQRERASGRLSNSGESDRM